MQSFCPISAIFFEEETDEAASQFSNYDGNKKQKAMESHIKSGIKNGMWLLKTEVCE